MSEEYRSAYDVHPREALESVGEGDEIRLAVDNDSKGGVEKTLNGCRAEFTGEVVDADAEARAADGVDVRVRWTEMPDYLNHVRRESPVGAHVMFRVWSVDVEFEFGSERETYIADEFEVVSR